jgi:hypothetical protein
MPRTISTPEVIRCYFDDDFTPPLPAMCLRWGPEGADETECLWGLPEGITLLGPAPRRFGFTIRRRGPNAYTVRLLWDRTGFQWRSVPRAELLGSALAPLLEALGTDLWYLLDQPVRTEGAVPVPAA